MPCTPKAFLSLNFLVPNKAKPLAEAFLHDHFLRPNKVVKVLLLNQSTALVKTFPS